MILILTDSINISVTPAQAFGMRAVVIIALFPFLIAGFWLYNLYITNLLISLGMYYKTAEIVAGLTVGLLSISTVFCCLFRCAEKRWPWDPEPHRRADD